MAKFKYIGDHAEITQHNITFKQGIPVDVTGKVLEMRKRVKSGAKVVTEISQIKVEDKLRSDPRHYEEVIEVQEPKKLGRPKGVINGGNKDRHSEPSAPTTKSFAG